MINLLQPARRPDISFSVNGRIRIAARVVHALGLRPGDYINIACDQGEYLLHAIHPDDPSVRLEARCYPSNPGNHYFCASSVRLCRALMRACGISSHTVAFAVGKEFVRDNATYLPIITRRPL